MRPRRDVTHAALADQARLRRLAEITADSLRGVRALGLVGVLDDATVGLLLVASDALERRRALESVSHRVRRSAAEADDRRGHRGRVDRRATCSRSDGRSWRRRRWPTWWATGAARPFHRLADVGLTGLLHLLRDDERLQTFVERELGLGPDVARASRRLAARAPRPARRRCARYLERGSQQVDGRGRLRAVATGVLRTPAADRGGARRRPRRRRDVPHPAGGSGGPRRHPVGRLRS